MFLYYVRIDNMFFFLSFESLNFKFRGTYRKQSLFHYKVPRSKLNNWLGSHIIYLRNEKLDQLLGSPVQPNQESLFHANFSSKSQLGRIPFCN